MIKRLLVPLIWMLNDIGPRIKPCGAPDAFPTNDETVQSDNQ